MTLFLRIFSELETMYKLYVQLLKIIVILLNALWSWKLLIIVFTSLFLSLNLSLSLLNRGRATLKSWIRSTGKLVHYLALKYMPKKVVVVVATVKTWKLVWQLFVSFFYMLVSQLTLWRSMENPTSNLNSIQLKLLTASCRIHMHVSLYVYMHV